jgi:hypothetical protein
MTMALRALVVAEVLAVLAATSACSSTVAYTPKPGTLTDPVANLEKVLSRYCDPKPARVEHGDGFSKAVWEGPNSHTKMVVYAELAEVKILKYLAAVQVVVYDPSGKELERFQTDSADDGKAVADALAAVAPRLIHD